jgi:hypothetical protein
VFALMCRPILIRAFPAQMPSRGVARNCRATWRCRTTAIAGCARAGMRAVGRFKRIRSEVARLLSITTNGTFAFRLWDAL